MASARSAGGGGARGKRPGASRTPRASGTSRTTGTPRASGSGGAPKKKRWSADERIARGRPAERPRGGDERAPRERERERDERPTGKKGGRVRVSTGRPNWEPRGKDARHTPAADSERPRFRGGERDRPRERDRDVRPRERDRDDRPRDRDRSDRDRPRDRDRAPREDRRQDWGPDRRSERPPRAPREERIPPPPIEDPVLERLQASAVQASDTTGLTFADLGLGANIVRVLEEQGASEPFPIQASTIPDALAGRDVLGRGRTGSGKTIAFGAPLVERLLQTRADRTPNERRKQGRAPEALILAPTRELALQIDRTVQPIARSVGLFTTQVYGGVPYARQYLALQKGVDIVIGTPGRVEDLVEQGRLDLSHVAITVLDEADHMAELGFLEPVQRILRRTPGGGQRMLFSASLDTAVTTLVDEFLRDPMVHEVAGDDVASSTIDHRVLVIPQREKRRIVSELVADRGPVLVFVRTRAFAEELSDLLDDEGIDAVALHGDLTQPRRSRNLQRFSQGRASVLVATDVAARGIHIDDVGLVIQADAPDEYKTYLHRSGRTGRAGKEGTVVTLVAPSRRRRTQELLERAGIDASWSELAPGDAAHL